MTRGSEAATAGSGPAEEQGACRPSDFEFEELSEIANRPSTFASKNEHANR